MKKSAVKCFISALKEWDKVTGEIKGTPFNSLLHFINCELCDDPLEFLCSATNQERLKDIENKSMYLIKKQRIREIFLVTSLINSVTKFLDSRIDSTLDAIQMPNKTIKKHEEKSQELNSNEQLKTLHSYEHKNLIKNVEKNVTRNEYFRWQSIVVNDLSEEKIERLVSRVKCPAFNF
jgi:RecG-like helicase